MGELLIIIILKVAKFLQTLNRTDIPIALGISTDEYIGPQYNYASNFSLDELVDHDLYFFIIFIFLLNYIKIRYEGIIFSDGVQAIIDTVSAYPNITFLELAPATNFAVFNLFLLL